jgi:D-sedoheptulose 7-phosphate isomerase
LHPLTPGCAAGIFARPEGIVFAGFFAQRREGAMSQGRPESPRDRLARVRATFEQSAQVQRDTAERSGAEIAEAAALVVEALRAGGRLLAFGNGGSAADAQHLVAELAGRFERERPGLPALALTANSSDVTAIANDYGFDRVFARLVEAHGRPGDLAFAISTSGNSPGVLAAVERARALGLRTVALVGKGGGRLAGMVDVAVVVPSDSTARVQEAHGTAIHAICEIVDASLPGGA